MGELWDVGKSTKKGIILNSHARTGLYKSWQMIVDNYIKQDKSFNTLHIFYRELEKT